MCQYTQYLVYSLKRSPFYTAKCRNRVQIFEDLLESCEVLALVVGLGWFGFRSSSVGKPFRCWLNYC